MNISVTWNIYLMFSKISKATEYDNIISSSNVDLDSILLESALFT